MSASTLPAPFRISSQASGFRFGLESAHDAAADELGALARADGRPALTFEIVYGHAFKAAPRPAPGAATSVSLDAMRKMVRAPRRGG